MKNKFEELLKTRKMLDEVLEVVNQQNTVLKKEIESNKSALYEQMFVDSYELYEYAKQLGFNYINLHTGIPAYAWKTFWLRLTPEQKIILIVATPEGEDEYYCFAFTRENNIHESKRSIISRDAEEYIYKILSQWDVAFNNMQNSLAEQAKAKMEKDILDAKKKQNELISSMNQFNK